MKAKTVLVLVLVAALLVGAAMWLGASRQPLQERAGAGGLLLPDLQSRINTIGNVRVQPADSPVDGAGDAQVAGVTLERSGEGWQVRERGGYPADVGKLRSVLLALAQAERVEAKTASPALHGKLGLADSGDGAGVWLEMAAGERTDAVMIGKPSGEGATFVRLAGDPQAWLVDRAIAVEHDASAWLHKELTQIDAQRVARVEITHADGDRVEIAANDAGPGFVIANLPKGREPQDDYAAEGTAGLLSALRLADVEPAAGEDPFGDVETGSARFSLRDGIDVDIEFFEEDDFVAAIFRASLDEARANAWIDGEQAKAAMEHERVQRDAKAQGGEEAADAPAAPLAVSDPAADRSARLAALREEVDTLKQRFDGWAFRLPPYKAEHLTRPLDGYLAPKD